MADNLKVTFGYQHPLKIMWKNGLLPSVKYGIYGLKDELEKDNVSLEHVIPISLGGKTEYNNLVLATRAKNYERGNHNIFLFTTEENIQHYLEQFKDIIVVTFSGNEYIKDILKTIDKLKRDSHKLDYRI